MDKPRIVAFVMAATDHGPMIVNRLDACFVDTPEGQQGFGVGLSLLTNSSYEIDDVVLCMKLLDERRKHYGDNVSVIDGGANIGTYTIPLARHMTGWGMVYALEAQERVFYALCGNIAVNNCTNAWAKNLVLGKDHGVMEVPLLDPSTPTSFGSLELVREEKTEFIGQDVNKAPTMPVEVKSIDDVTQGDRVDLIKLDVEGMEMQVLDGAEQTLLEHHPILLIEYVKIDRTELVKFLEANDYVWHVKGRNVLAIHRTDPSLWIAELED